MANARTVLGDVLPKRLAQRLCEHWLPDRPVRQLDEPDLRKAAQVLSAFPLVASGTEGYRTAEVTLGGVDTNEISSSTLESKLHQETTVSHGNFLIRTRMFISTTSLNVMTRFIIRTRHHLTFANDFPAPGS